MTHDDDLLVAWLGSETPPGPVDGLEVALARARSLGQRPAWVVALTGGTIAHGPQAPLLRFAAFGVALVALVGLTVGAMALGGLLPGPRPAPSIVAIASGEPSPRASAAPSVQPSEPPQQLVAYKRTDALEPGQGVCTEDAPSYRCLLDRIWIARADGSDARLLHPDVFEGEELYGWMPDGSGLLIADAQSPIVLVGTDGGVIGRWGEDLLCPSPCAAIRDPRVSPDGSRIAFVRQSGNEREGSVLAILDLATSIVIELEATRVTNPTSDCWSGAACPGLAAGLLAAGHVARGPRDGPPDDGRGVRGRR
jgi:hypothetical protein